MNKQWATEATMNKQVVVTDFLIVIIIVDEKIFIFVCFSYWRLAFLFFHHFITLCNIIHDIIHYIIHDIVHDIGPYFYFLVHSSVQFNK